MNKDQLKTELRQFVIETFLFGDESETFADSDSFMQTGIVDSTGILEITNFVEEKYAVTIENEEMIPANLDSVENLAQFISRKAGV